MDRRDKSDAPYREELERCAKQVHHDFPDTSEALRQWIEGCIEKRAALHHEAYAERWVSESTRTFRRALRKQGLGARVDVRIDGSVLVTGAPPATHPKYRAFLGDQGVVRITFS